MCGGSFATWPGSGWGYALCAAVVVVYGITHADWRHWFLAGITLALELLQEEFPVVLTIFLALRAWRLSRRNVRTRQLPEVETLGAATVLCVDKTGTLTLNRMSIRKLLKGGTTYDLTQNEQQSLPEEFHEFDNLQKAMAYTFAVHFPIAGMSLLPVILRWPLVLLLPVHILFLELVLDPACSVVFEAEPPEADVMDRPSRNPHESLVSRQTLGLGCCKGASVLLVFAWSYYRGEGELYARALGFTTLVVANLGLILANRSWSPTIVSMLRGPNPALWWMSGVR